MNIQQIIKQHHLELLFQQGSLGLKRKVNGYMRMVQL